MNLLCLVLTAMLEPRVGANCTASAEKTLASTSGFMVFVNGQHDNDVIMSSFVQGHGRILHNFYIVIPGTCSNFWFFVQGHGTILHKFYIVIPGTLVSNFAFCPGSWYISTEFLQSHSRNYLKTFFENSTFAQT